IDPRASGGISIDRRADHRNLAQAARRDNLSGFELRRRADVLAADLQNASGLLDRRDDLYPFVNFVGQGLFDVNVLARFDRGDGGRLVPVVGRADVDGVNARRGQQFAGVFEDFRATFRHLYSMFAASFVSVAERDNLETRNLHYVVERLVGARADADKP